jgi:hypothetical protein
LNPKVEFFGVAIAEPMTMATDYAIAVVCAWFAARLCFSEDNRRYFCRKAWGTGYFFISFALLLGGTNHGFAPYLSSGTMSLVWTIAYYAAGLSMALLVAGTVASSVPARSWRNVFHGLNALGFLVYSTWVTISDDSYRWVIIISIVSFGAIALIQGWTYVTRESKSAKWLIAGVFVSFLSAAVQQSGIDLHVYFNHNDLYHVVQMIGLYLLYRGAELLEDLH